MLTGYVTTIGDGCSSEPSSRMRVAETRADPSKPPGRLTTPIYKLAPGSWLRPQTIYAVPTGVPVATNVAVEPDVGVRVGVLVGDGVRVGVLVAVRVSVGAAVVLGVGDGGGSVAVLVGSPSSPRPNSENEETCPQIWPLTESLLVVTSTHAPPSKCSSFTLAGLPNCPGS